MPNSTPIPMKSEGYPGMPLAEQGKAQLADLKFRPTMIVKPPSSIPVAHGSNLAIQVGKVADIRNNIEDSVAKNKSKPLKRLKVSKPKKEDPTLALLARLEKRMDTVDNIDTKMDKQLKDTKDIKKN